MKARQGKRRASSAATRAAGTAVLMAVLTACGGGGGADSVALAPNAPPSGSGLTSGGGNPQPPGDPNQPGNPGDPSDPQPAPTEFRINLTTAGDQGFAAGAALAAGGFAAVWTSSPDGAHGDVRLKRFDAEGRPASAEIIVTAQGRAPEMAALADGGFLATWSNSAFANEVEAYAQRFDADAVPIGAPVRVGRASNKFVGRPAGLPDGGFVLAADVQERFGPETGLVTRFTADGQPSESTVLVSDVSPPVGGADPNFVRGTVAAAWPDGRFAVAWIAGGSTTSELRLTRFDAQGGMLGTEVLMSDVQLHEPALAVLPGGQLAIAWVSGPLDAIKTVFLEVLDAGGTSLGRQNARNFLSAIVVPRLAPLADGGFALAIRDTDFGTGLMRSNVHARRYDAAGQPAGDFEQISTTQAPTGSPITDHDSIDALGLEGGGFVVLHGIHSQASGWDVYGARR